MPAATTRLSVEIEGTTHDLSFKPGDLVRAERHYGQPFEELAKRQDIEHVLYLAWLVCVRTKTFEGDFEAFLDAVDGVTDPDAVPDPTDDPDAPAPEPFQPVDPGGDADPLAEPGTSSPPSQ